MTHGDRDYVPVETPHAQSPPALLTPNHLHSLAQKWYAIRWQLARSVFARPVPFLTEKLELKLGDLLVTLPVAAAFIAINASTVASGDVGGGGSPAAIVMIIVFAMAVRNNAILLLATGIPFDRAIFYHKFFGGVAWIVSGLHGLAYLLSDDDKGNSEDSDRGHGHERQLRHEGQEDGAFPRQLSGALTFYALSALVVFAFEPIRRRFFDFFQRFHWIFIVLIVVFAVIHGAAIVLIGFVPYLLDMVYRYGYRTRQFAREGGAIHASQVTLKLVAKDIVRVQFPRPPVSANGPNFRYEAGQYAFLCIPEVSALEWHPFTIASAPHESHVTFFIKSSGDWTKQLAAFTAQKKSDEPVAVLVDGPYGNVAIEMDHYSHFVFVCGGIGITPMMSLANDLHYAARSRRTPVQKAWFVWAVRDREMVQALMLDGAHTSTDRENASWLPHVLTSPSNANSQEYDTFFADFYLTNKTQDLSETVDQQLALCLKHSQRPDVPAILRSVGESALASNTVETTKPVRLAVLVCGPAAMVSNVVAQSQKMSKSLGVVFDVHQETFAW